MTGKQGGGQPLRDRKASALRASRTLNQHPEAVSDERFSAGGFFDARDVVQVKYEMVRTTREDGASVTAAAAAFGLSRQSFYQAEAALAEGGLAALVPRRPGPRGGSKLTAEVIAWIGEQKDADPRLGAAALAAMAAGQFGITIHPRSVQRALARRASPKSGG